MLPAVFVQLKTSTDVRNIVGERIWRHGHVPDSMREQNPDGTSKPITFPFVTWILVSGVPENNLSDPPPVDRSTIQLDCWHQTDKGVLALAIAVRDSLEQIGVMTNTLIDERETETKLFRMSMQFDIFITH